MKLSLRSQLSLWLGVAVLVIVLLTTFVAQQVTVWNIESSIDSALQKRAHMVAAIISSDVTTDETSYVNVMNELAKQEFPFVPLLLRIISPRGTLIAEFGRVSSPIVQSLDERLGAPNVGKGRFDSIMLPGIDPLRAYTISVSDPRTHQTLAIVQAVETLGQVGQARDQLWRNGISAGLTVALFAVTIGLVLIRRGFRPLRTILKTIDQVDYSHLKTQLQRESRPAELEELAKGLTNMWQRLDAAVSTKQKAVGDISHDLRTPLTALQGQLEVLLLQPSLGPETRDSLERMLRETGRLVRMVKNLLLNVQLESRPAVVAEQVNLRDLVDEVVGDVWVLSRGVELSVVAPRDQIVPGDRDLLKQALLNVVDNAIKFTPNGGRVELKLIEESGWAVLSVSDSGRGIPSQQLAHVMEPFYRIGDSSRKPEGVGARLGLSIVKQIVDLHGGRTEIRSQEGSGTIVRLILPAGGARLMHGVGHSAVDQSSAVDG